MCKNFVRLNTIPLGIITKITPNKICLLYFINSEFTFFVAPIGQLTKEIQKAQNKNFKQSEVEKTNMDLLHLCI